jgi:uncharacterized membrane protein
LKCLFLTFKELCKKVVFFKKVLVWFKMNCYLCTPKQQEREIQRKFSKESFEKIKKIKKIFGNKI